MVCEVKPTTRRDLCFTAANARTIDKEEIIASGPRNMTEAGWITWDAIEYQGGIGWSVWLDGNPEFSFGFSPVSIVLMPHLWTAWGWGSEKTDLIMPELSRWSKINLVKCLDIVGAKRIEARTIHHNFKHHRWLEWVGFRKECDLPEWGKDGERFVQYTWLRSRHAVDRHGNVRRG
jgi:hypothetical protein